MARIDVKSDRRAGMLRVLGAVARELADELRLLAGWLELEHISVATKGDLAGTLANAVRRPASSLEWISSHSRS